jgi:hypothetical protein
MRSGFGTPRPATDVSPPDDGHFAEEDIDELRQFINPRQPYDLADAGKGAG